MGTAGPCFYVAISAEHTYSEGYTVRLDQVGFIYYGLLKPNEIIVGERYGL